MFKLFACVSVYLSVYISICMSVCMSVCSVSEISKSNLHPSYPVSCRRSESQNKILILQFRKKTIENEKHKNGGFRQTLWFWVLSHFCLGYYATKFTGYCPTDVKNNDWRIFKDFYFTLSMCYQHVLYFFK